jgi:hypothetical protein
MTVTTCLRCDGIHFDVASVGASGADRTLKVVRCIECGGALGLVYDGDKHWTVIKAVEDFKSDLERMERALTTKLDELATKIDRIRDAMP